MPYEPSYKEGESSIAFKDFTRFSARQQTKMQLGGIMGHINYDEIDAKSYALLKLGEIMGVGKQTVFGLGEIRVDKLTETDNISA
ncbi:MAG: CRISPR system precrRNA processing endoribonuclease RAMP protein Cas6 [Helicobacteraceae bacterium]|nr:CRISPR system precrRNA processing endoribonuclease RAMP protein Cas6 [Helicobacteraceae bacterium]